MSNFQLRTPVAFFIFNRPETTEKVFSEIAKAKPPRLLVVADGPRPDIKGEKERCDAARKVIDKIDWECKVLTNYADQNMGCRDRVSNGLNWVFEQVDEAIILEDDCLPHPTFFRFCEELLEKYRIDERIMMISGDNFQFGNRRTTYSYYFSRFNHIWGWATWRRAWKHYDVDIKFWGKLRKERWLYDILSDRHEVAYWTKTFNLIFENKIDTWDFQWVLACWIQSGLTILPNINLVSNIGFGDNSTHTSGHNKVANMETYSMSYPLKHPPFVLREVLSDKKSAKLLFNKPFYRRILIKIREIFSRS